MTSLFSVVFLRRRHVQRDFSVGRVLGAVWASFNPHHWTISIGVIGADDYGDGPEASLAVGVGPCSLGLRLGVTS